MFAGAIEVAQSWNGGSAADLRHTPAGGRGAFVLNILSVSYVDLYVVVRIHC